MKWLKRLSRIAFLLFLSPGISGCISLNNPVTSRVIAAITSSSSISGGGCAGPVTSVVAALYAANGSNWMDHVQTAATGNACNGATTTNGFESCIHGGERRRVDLTGIDDCTGITATDALGAFDWVCDDNGASDAYVYSVSLKKGKGLSDLLNATGTAFLTNSVTVERSGCTVVTTNAATWWSNTITVLTDNATDQTPVDLTGANSGTIYTVPNDTSIDGVFIGGDKIAIVTLGTASLRYSGMGYDSNADGNLEANGNCMFTGVSSTTAGAACLIAVAGADFIWLEGRFRGDHDANYVATYNPQTPADTTRVIFFTGTSTYNTLRNVTANGGLNTSFVVYLAGNSPPNFANSRIYNLKSFGATNSAGASFGGGLLIDDAQYNIFEKINISASYGSGLESSESSYNRFINVKVANSRGHGLTLNGNPGGPTYSQETTVVNLISAGNGSPNDFFNINFGITRRNTIAQFSHGNYTNGSVWASSLELYTGSINPEKNSLVNQLIVNSNKSGIYLEDTTDTLVNTLAASHIGGAGTDSVIRILGGSVGFALSGRVWWGNMTGGGDACTVAGNITTVNCQYGGATNPLSTALDLLTDLTGQTTDTLNSHGATGNVTYANLNTGRGNGLTDWILFDSFLKLFGLYGGAAGLAAEDQGPCLSGNTCQIYSLGLEAAAALKDINGAFSADDPCPSSVDAAVATNVFTDQLTAPNTFLINAREVIDDYDSNGDRIGDDDGLCESNEACIFLPDIGASNLLEPNTSSGTCVFTGGNGVVGVTMYSGIAE